MTVVIKAKTPNTTFIMIWRCQCVASKKGKGRERARLPPVSAAGEQCERALSELRRRPDWGLSVLRLLYALWLRSQGVGERLPDAGAAQGTEVRAAHPRLRG